jgi:hypothetical protein
MQGKEGRNQEHHHCMGRTKLFQCLFCSFGSLGRQWLDYGRKFADQFAKAITVRKLLPQ